MTGNDEYTPAAERESGGEGHGTAAVDGAETTRPGAHTDVDTADLVKQRDDLQDLLLRRTAEFDNYRKRVERERREMAEYATGEFARDLLPIVDDFTRALSTGGGSDDAFRQGIDLVFRRFLDALSKRGMTVLDPLGEQFDPHQHEAVARTPSAGHRDGEIVEVFSRGFKLGDRLLRPAMVKVATS